MVRDNTNPAMTVLEKNTYEIISLTPVDVLTISSTIRANDCLFSEKDDDPMLSEASPCFYHPECITRQWNILQIVFVRNHYAQGQHLLYKSNMMLSSEPEP